MARNRLPIYDGEKLEIISGSPTLYKYFPADPSNPLLVFVPGAVHNARISYGCHNGASPENFLSTWIKAKRYPFLALSYPTESLGDGELMPPTSPGFRVTDWGRQAAEITQRIVLEHNLPGRIVLLGWSMGGKILEPFTTAAKGLNLSVELFISLASTPGIYGLRGKVPLMEQTKAGYVAYKGIIDRMVRTIHEQSLSGSSSGDIIPDDVYLRDYLGYTPVGLTSWGFRFSYQNGVASLIKDEWEVVEDSRADNFGNLPFMTAIYGSSPEDLRHTVADKATWGLMLTYKLLADIERYKAEAGPGQLVNDDNWIKLLALVHSAPDEMSNIIDGTHLFFLGDRGARTTADLIELHIRRAKNFQDKFLSLLHRLKFE